MTAEEFVRLVGPRLVHITPTRNLVGIEAIGLLPAAMLAERAGVHAEDIILRQDRRLLDLPSGAAQLNHQRPLRMGLNKAVEFLEGHTPESWAAQLDKRIFFWPSEKGASFAKSLSSDAIALAIDARSFFEAFIDHIYLSPINSGNADRRPARRGDWIYVPTRNGVETFRENRRRRGLVKNRDSVAEISLTSHIPIATLRTLTV